MEGIPGVSLGILVAAVPDDRPGQREEFLPPRQESGSVRTQLRSGLVHGDLRTGERGREGKEDRKSPRSVHNEAVSISHEMYDLGFGLFYAIATEFQLFLSGDMKKA